MKKVLKEIKSLAKLNVEELRVVIKVNAKNDQEFYSILEELDQAVKDLPFKWSRYDNQADIDRTKQIVFTY